MRFPVLLAVSNPRPPPPPPEPDEEPAPELEPTAFVIPQR